MGESFEILNIIVEVLRCRAKTMGPWGLHISILKTLQSLFRRLARPTVCDISARNFIRLLKIDFNYLANYFC